MNDQQYKEIIECLVAYVKRVSSKHEASLETRYLEQVKTLRQTLLDEYTALQNQTWDESQAVCPTCNRELPEENVTQMRETFNLTKSQKLQSINTRGQQEANQKMIEEELKDIENVQASMAACEKQILVLEAELAELQKAIINPVPFEATDTYMALSVQLAARSAQESDQEKRISGIIEHLESKIKDLERELDAQQTLKANLAAAARQKERITELKATEKELAAQYEDIESGIYLCEQFIRAKVSRLNDQINSRFKRVRFRLFQEKLKQHAWCSPNILQAISRGGLVSRFWDYCRIWEQYRDHQRRPGFFPTLLLLAANIQSLKTPY